MFNHYDEILRAARELDKMRNNPAYQALMEHQRRLASDPAYRANMEHINRLQNDPAHQALLNFRENQHLYRQISDPQITEAFDKRALDELRTLRNALAHHNAEFWVKNDFLNSNINLRQFDELLSHNKNLIPLSPEIIEAEDEETNFSKAQIAARIVNEFYENRSAAEQELDDDEKLIAVVRVGKREFKVVDLAVEEETNKIAAFLDDESEAAFIYCPPFLVNYRFYKEQI